MAQEEKTNAPSSAQPSDTSAQLVQQGYSQALGDLSNLVNNYQFSNEANRPTTVEAFKNHLFKLDRGVVKKMFDTARDLRNKPDLAFTINELPNVKIPKKIFTDELKTSGKKFLTDYDQRNYQNLQVKSQAEASAKSEGAAGKLDAAKSAVLGTSFGAVGAALGGMVGVKAGRAKARSKPEKKTEPAPIEKEFAEPTAETKTLNSSSPFSHNAGERSVENKPTTSIEAPVTPTTGKTVRGVAPAHTSPSTAKVTTSVTTTLRGVGPSAAPAETAGGTLRGVGPAPTSQAAPPSGKVKVGGEVKTEAQTATPTSPSAAEAAPQAAAGPAQAAQGLSGKVEAQTESTVAAPSAMQAPPPVGLPTPVPTGLELASKTSLAGRTPSAPLTRRRPGAAAMQVATGASLATPHASVTRRMQRADRRPTAATIVAPATSSVMEVGTSEIPAEEMVAEGASETPEVGAMTSPPAVGNLPSATPIAPAMAGLASRRPAAQVRGSAPTTRRAPQSAKGYRRVGPQEIKPPIGRSLEMGRAMGLHAAQAADGRMAGNGQVLLENLPPEQLEGLGLSKGGETSELSEGTGEGPSLPAFGQFYDPFKYRRPAIFVPQYLGPGSMAMEPEELETEETEGGTPEGDIERLQSFQAEQQQANLASEQLTGAPTEGPAPSQYPQRGAWAGASQRGPAPTRGGGAYSGSDTVKQLSTALQLKGQQMQLARVGQAQFEKVESLKASLESIQRAKRAFKNLLDVGEIAGSESGMTLLTLWGEWNIDLINKHVAGGKIPFFEQKPSQGALPLEKTISQVKDGITIFADIVIPISIIVSMVLPLIFTAIIVLSSFKVIMAMADFFGIKLI